MCRINSCLHFNVVCVYRKVKNRKGGPCHCILTPQTEFLLDVDVAISSNGMQGNQDSRCNQKNIGQV